MSGSNHKELDECVRKNVAWSDIPIHLKQVRNPHPTFPVTSTHSHSSPAHTPLLIRKVNATADYLSNALQVLNNTPREYDKYVFNFSLKNQLRFRGNLVRKVLRNEKRYYELLVEKSQQCLNIFPYHLADIVTKGLRVTPFNYYLEIVALLLRADRSYDTLPNFTAIDCELLITQILRLLTSPPLHPFQVSASWALVATSTCR